VLGITAEEKKSCVMLEAACFKQSRLLGHCIIQQVIRVGLFSLLYAPSGWPGFRTFSHSSCRIRRCSANSVSVMKPELIVPISNNKCK
jgi:hypothetical protein